MAKPRTSDPLARLRAICLAHEGAIEKLSHGEPTWFTGPKGKVFAMYDNHHHGAAHISVWVPTVLELRDALVESEPARYFVPPYVGHKGWVAVVIDTAPDWNAVTQLVAEAFAMMQAPRKPTRIKPTTTTGSTRPRRATPRRSR
jgi:hypothetical protein